MAAMQVELQVALEAKKQRLPLVLQLLAGLDESQRPAAVVAAEARRATAAIAAMKAARESERQAAIERRAEAAWQELQRQAQLLKEEWDNERAEELERCAARREVFSFPI